MCMDIFISDRKKHHNNTNELKWKGGKTSLFTLTSCLLRCGDSVGLMLTW